jgi:hypothetical protein
LDPLFIGHPPQDSVRRNGLSFNLEIPGLLYRTCPKPRIEGATPGGKIIKRLNYGN